MMIGGVEGGDFNEQSPDPEQLQQLARAADAGYRQAMFVLAHVFGMNMEDLAELQVIFRSVVEESLPPDDI